MGRTSGALGPRERSSCVAASQLVAAIICRVGLNNWIKIIEKHVVPRYLLIILLVYLLLGLNIGFNCWLLELFISFKEALTQ